jgi:uncharacterized protein YfiM (DUF2279 family)
MKTFLLILLLMLSMTAFCQRVDKWIAEDKLLHFTVSMTFSQAPMEILKDLNVKNPEIKGAIIMFSVGCSKEFFYDKRPSYKDLTTNLLGCIAGVYLNKLYQNIQKKKSLKI